MIPASASYNFTIRMTQQLHQIWGFLPTTRPDKEEEPECEKKKEGNREIGVGGLPGEAYGRHNSNFPLRIQS
ncbi:unnamed protein product [Boreogadus saida]